MNRTDIKTVKITERQDKLTAINLAGQLLLEMGCIKEAYIVKMHEREELVTTYLGNYVAIPHGTDDAKKAIIRSGISIIQYPNGADFGNGNIAHLVIGIAGKDNDHLDILSKIAINCQDEEKVLELSSIDNEEQLINMLVGE